jgi:hypothetical protein
MWCSTLYVRSAAPGDFGHRGAVWQVGWPVLIYYRQGRFVPMALSVAGWLGCPPRPSGSLQLPPTTPAEQRSSQCSSTTRLSRLPAALQLCIDQLHTFRQGRHDQRVWRLNNIENLAVIASRYIGAYAPCESSMIRQSRAGNGNIYMHCASYNKTGKFRLNSKPHFL